MSPGRAKEILAVVTRDPGQVRGGVAVFTEPDEEARKEMAFLLGRILDAMVHDIGGDMWVIVRH